jgi:hypothetical protein
MAGGCRTLAYPGGFALRTPYWLLAGGPAPLARLSLPLVRLLADNPVNDASSVSDRATRSERAGEAASESACRGVRGAKPLGLNG